MYDYILAFDPSGNFEEGKGTTGWCLLDKSERLLGCGEIKAEEFQCKEAYWDEVVALLENMNQRFPNLIVVIEEYILYRDKCKSQTNSKMETCRLIGVLQWTCYKLQQPYSMQLATSVMHRWEDGLLIREGIVDVGKGGLRHKKSGKSLQVVHVRDAFRHAIHYAVCRNQDKPKKEQRRITRYEQSNYDRDYTTGTRSDGHSTKYYKSTNTKPRNKGRRW